MRAPTILFSLVAGTAALALGTDDKVPQAPAAQVKPAAKAAKSSKRKPTQPKNRAIEKNLDEALRQMALIRGRTPIWEPVAPVRVVDTGAGSGNAPLPELEAVPPADSVNPVPASAAGSVTQIAQSAAALETKTEPTPALPARGVPPPAPEPENLVVPALKAEAPVLGAPPNLPRDAANQPQHMQLKAPTSVVAPAVAVNPAAGQPQSLPATPTVAAPRPTPAPLPEVPTAPRVDATIPVAPKAAPHGQTMTPDEFVSFYGQGKGLDTRPFAQPLPADANHKRQLWNIWPVTYYGRISNLRFASFDTTLGTGEKLGGSIGNNEGIGVGATVEAFPNRYGAVFFSWDYRYGFGSKIDVNGPALYQIKKLDLAVRHQVSFGVHAGFRMPWVGEWSIGFEQRAEGYRVSGPSGTPSTAWLSRPWIRTGVRWSLNQIRDLRPFLAVDVAVPVRSPSKVDGAQYAKDTANLLGVFPQVPVGQIPATTAADGVARAHPARYEFTVSYGVRLFRPRRKWSGPASGVQQVPTRPAGKRDYTLPADAFMPEGPKKEEPKKEGPKEPKKDAPAEPKKGEKDPKKDGQ